MAKGRAVGVGLWPLCCASVWIYFPSRIYLIICQACCMSEGALLVETASVYCDGGGALDYLRAFSCAAFHVIPLSMYLL